MLVQPCPPHHLLSILASFPVGHLSPVARQENPNVAEQSLCKLTLSVRPELLLECISMRAEARLGGRAAKRREEAIERLLLQRPRASG